MPSPALISGLSDVASRYDAAVVDVWGVIHNGVAAFAPAVDACRRFRSERGPVVLVSNAPRPSSVIPRALERLGATPDFFDAIATSGDATRVALKARAPGPAWKLGPMKDERIYEGTGVEFAPLEEAAFISCTGPFDELKDTPEDYVEAFKGAIARDLEMVCANPDLVVQLGDRLIYCAGALAAKYAELGGRVLMCGKPHEPVYDLARAAIKEVAGAEIPSARILAIGDGPDTDILGAMRQGFGVLFIGEGINEAETHGPEGFDPDRARALLARKERRADYLAPVLSW